MLSSAAISFSHVTHEYTPGNPVLRDVTFSVPGGSTTALVCVSTSCKTALTANQNFAQHAQELPVRPIYSETRLMAAVAATLSCAAAASWL